MGLTNFTQNGNSNGSNNGNNGNGPVMNPFLGGGNNGLNGPAFDPEDYMTNLNKKALAAQSPTLFRDAVIAQTESVLIGHSKPNPLLIGAAGVGKTAIAEELAYRIASNNPLVPLQLNGYTVWGLQLSDMVAGAGIVGELEERTQNIVDFLSDPANKAIVFIDEIHLLFSDNAYKKIAQILKPAMSRGMIKVIGATTTQESACFDDDPALKRRFTRILVDELSREQTQVILNGYVNKLRKHYNTPFNFDDGLAKTIVNIADTFCSSGSHRPDNALTLLDRAIADNIVKKQEMLQDPDPMKVAMAKNMAGIILTEASIQKTALKITTGNNTAKEFSESELRDALSVIKGQDEIIEQLIKVIKLHNLHIRPSKRPTTFMFLGASGVGKTEITKILASVYLDEKPIILNMGEYSEKNSINRIIGAPAGYIGYDSNGEMPFDILDTNPYQIILLDEFEKAHRTVQRLFMSVCDEGVLTTNKGKVIDFSKAIIIATTNAGCTNDFEDAIGFDSDGNNMSEQSIERLSAYFDIELINRFRHRWTFNTISRTVFAEIMAETYKKDVANIKINKPRLPIPDELSPNELEKLVNANYVPELGARPISTAIETYVDEQILALP